MGTREYWETTERYRRQIKRANMVMDVLMQRGDDPETGGSAYWNTKRRAQFTKAFDLRAHALAAIDNCR